MGLGAIVRCAGLAALLATGHAGAADWSAAYLQPPEQLFERSPPQWRAYLIQAHKAELQPDRLQRCLAYPDLPGQHWPPGHAAAHCRLHAAHSYTPREVVERLRKGEAGALEAEFRSLVERHASREVDDESLDVALDLFGSGAEADAASAAWLKAAPDSPYAHLARAEFLRATAAQARGGKFAAETPRENLRRMSELIAQAVPRYEEALRREPRLMSAYAGLIHAARMDSLDDVGESALARAWAVDPSCSGIALAQMEALEPRWGGSYESMLAYASRLSPHVQRRPLLAMHLPAPYADRADRLRAAKQSETEVAELLEIATRAGSLEASSRDAASLRMNADDETLHDDWRALAYLLQEARFSTRSAWTHRNIGRLMIRRDPVVGLLHLRRAEELEPSDAYVHYAIGASLYNTGRYEEAEAEYRQALADPDRKRAALHELVTMWSFDAGLDRKAGAARARPYLDQLLAAYPDDDKAWAYRIFSDGILRGGASDEVVQSFLRHADRTDPRQAELVRSIEEARKHPLIRRK